MIEPMQELLPNNATCVYHIGMYKQNQTAIQYYNRLPKECNADIAYVLDPLLSSSTTVGAVISILKKVNNIHMNIIYTFSFFIIFLCF